MIEMPTASMRGQAKEEIVTAINALGQAKDALVQLGATERASELRSITLKLGTILASV